VKAADIIAGINARLSNVESFRPLSLGPQCIGLWSIRQDGLSCRLEIVIDERWRTYPVRLLLPLRTGAGANVLLQRMQSALRHQTLVIEHHIEGDVPWILVRFHLWPGFYVEGLPWIIHAVVLSLAGAAHGTSGTNPAKCHGVSATPENVSRCRHDRVPNPGPLPEGERDSERAARDFHGTSPVGEGARVRRSVISSEGSTRTSIQPHRAVRQDT